MSGRELVRAAGRGRVLLLAAILAVAARAPRAAAEARQAETDPADGLRTTARRVEETFGVRIDSVRMSAEGHVVDLRYRVLDPERASPLFERGLRASLFDEASGRMLTVPSGPKTGPLRSSGRPTAGRTYFILFSNAGGAVRCGSRVALLLGDLEVGGLVVE